MTTPEAALQRLMDGNKRFLNNQSQHPNRCEETRKALLEGQKPYAVVLSCSDSRVPVEIIFDAGFGELFVVRTAGHTLSEEVVGSIEYAVQALDVKLVMILGHSKCGAVQSAISYSKKKDLDGESDNLKLILEHIQPAIEKTASCCESDECYLDEVIKSNVKYQVSQLIKKDRYIAALLKLNAIKVVAANYNMETAEVELLD